MTLTIDVVRDYIRDLPEFNFLSSHQEMNRDKDIDLAMSLALDEFNKTPPITNIVMESFPKMSVLLHGTCYFLANMEASRQLANQITYSAQGLTTDINGKHQQYLQLAQYYQNLFERGTKEYKQSVNMAKAFGGVESPYSRLVTPIYRSPQ